MSLGIFTSRKRLPYGYLLAVVVPFYCIAIELLAGTATMRVTSLAVMNTTN